MKAGFFCWTPIWNPLSECAPGVDRTLVLLLLRASSMVWGTGLSHKQLGDHPGHLDRHTGTRGLQNWGSREPFSGAFEQAVNSLGGSSSLRLLCRSPNVWRANVVAGRCLSLSSRPGDQRGVEHLGTMPALISRLSQKRVSRQRGWGPGGARWGASHTTPLCSAPRTPTHPTPGPRPPSARSR